MITTIFIFLTIIFLFFFWILDFFVNKKARLKKQIIKKIATSAMFIDLAIILQIVEKLIFAPIASIFNLPLTNIPLTFCGIYNGVFMGYVSGVIFDILLLFSGFLKSFNFGFLFTNGLVGAISGICVMLLKRYQTSSNFFKKYFLTFFIGFFFVFIGTLITIEIIFFNNFHHFLRNYYGRVLSTSILWWFMLLLLIIMILMIIFGKKIKTIKFNPNISLTFFLAFLIQYFLLSLFFDPLIYHFFFSIPYKFVYLSVLFQPLSFLTIMFFSISLYYKMNIN